MPTFTKLASGHTMAPPLSHDTYSKPINSYLPFLSDIFKHFFFFLEVRGGVVCALSPSIPFALDLEGKSSLCYPAIMDTKSRSFLST